MHQCTLEKISTAEVTTVLVIFTLVMDNSSTVLVTSARAGVKTVLVAHLAELEQQNLLCIIGQFLGPVTKR